MAPIRRPHEQPGFRSQVNTGTKTGPLRPDANGSDERHRSVLPEELLDDLVHGKAPPVGDFRKDARTAVADDNPSEPVISALPQLRSLALQRIKERVVILDGRAGIAAVREAGSTPTIPGLVLNR